MPFSEIDPEDIPVITDRIMDALSDLTGIIPTDIPPEMRRAVTEILRDYQ